MNWRQEVRELQEVIARDDRREEMKKQDKKKEHETNPTVT